ncbi:Hypothetical protein PHPALM_6498 [Phytophthora palmivora]|uniref:Uncharacterized protein n=1 Tax=Phytophthora palmivora TaxID=4796 RepID=A0A2P4YEQ6_9STRA|nr:Hypothetical protein PHPALM_6498 [Phytophthora palmivora]
MSTSNPTTTTATASSDSKQAIILLPTDVRCSYPSKLCNSHRATKDNGDLHKLCDFHRKKANVNQQRMQQKRRLLRQQMLERKKRLMETAQPPIEFYIEPCVMEPEKPICDLSPEELVILKHLLFDEKDDKKDDEDDKVDLMLLLAGNPSCMMYPSMYSGSMSL